MHPILKCRNCGETFVAEFMELDSWQSLPLQGWAINVEDTRNTHTCNNKFIDKYKDKYKEVKLLYDCIGFVEDNESEDK